MPNNLLNRFQADLPRKQAFSAMYFWQPYAFSRGNLIGKVTIPSESPLKFLPHFAQITLISCNGIPSALRMTLSLLDERTFVLILSQSMSIWERFLYLIGKHPTPDPRSYHFEISESLKVSLSTIATDEGRPEHELIPDILAAGLIQYTSNERLWTKWETLSSREKDVAAFVCLGYTNREIGARLNISPDTVKSRLQNVLRKFNAHKRTELMVMLAHWDFGAWQK